MFGIIKKNFVKLKNYPSKKIKENQMKQSADEVLKKYDNEFPNLYTTTQLIQMIVEEGKSISRFGDGEFELLQCKNLSFQDSSPELAKKLNEILYLGNSKKLIICIPPFNSEYNNTKNIIGKYSFWQVYWFYNFEKIKGNLNREKKYGNAFISRLDVFYENELSEIKQMWAKRKVVFVYGEGSRFNIKSELFDNIEQKKEIITKSINAFQDYADIWEQCTSFEKDTLFLLALGPTATVLSYDLSEKGYQALDIGHISNSYDQYLGRIKSPESLPINK